MAEKKRRWRVTRRGFLIGLGAAGAGLAVGVALGRRPFYRFMAGMLAGGEGGPVSYSDDPFAWFEITPDNEVRLYVGKVEMGQGIHTALAQIGAEELGVDFARLEVVQATTAGGPGGTITSASNSVSSTYGPLREAAAALRTMLTLEASRRLGVAADRLEARSGVITSLDDPVQQLTFGEIVAGAAEWPELAEPPVLKASDQFEVIGRPLPRIDFAEKITGRALYGFDMRIEGMAYGAAVHPPSLGAVMKSAAPGDAAGRPGVLEVVIDLPNQFAGVVARTRQQAWTAVNALEIEWEEGRRWTQAELEARLNFEEVPGYTIQKEGSPDAILREGPSLTSEYWTPFAAHAHLEPIAALADVRGDGARIWTATQAQESVRDSLADLLDLPPEAVVVTPTYLGGGFGRKLDIEAAREAALLSRAAGRPVHVGWSRLEDLRYGYFRPATRSRLSATLDGGRVEAIAHDHVSGEVAFSSFPTFLTHILGTDFGAWRGAFNFYDGIPHRSLTTYLAPLPLPTGWWRGLGLLANIFAMESFMDEMAHVAGADPLAFRLAHLGDDPESRRLAGVLEAAAERSGYGRPLPPGRAHGLACAPDVGTMVAMVAEISLSETGEIQVHRMTAAVDAGLFINPDGAKAQTQGAIIMGLSSTLIEELTIEDGRVAPANFDTYPLLTLDRAPEIEVILLESDGRPRGMGEPPIGPVAAAVGNALYNLTGRRLRRLPFTPERIQAA